MSIAQYRTDKDKMIAWRRHFHSYPEMSFEEFETSEYIAQLLTEMNLTVKRNVGGTGVVATLETGRPGPAIAFRADMDALPVFEETGLPFESSVPGVMHACGHDAHMAILLGTAKYVSENRERFCGTIRFIFQPGEEANGGAKCIIHDGALKNPDISAIFAVHMIPELPTGTVGIRSGYMSATDDEFVIRITGRVAHSSEPEVGVNAVRIGAYVVAALDSILASNINPFDTATLSICQFHGGEAVNVVPESVEMKGMIRCIEKENKNIIRKKMSRIVENTAEAFGGTGETEFIPGFPAVNNDPKLTGIVREAAAKVLPGGKENVIEIVRPHLGSEDFAYYQEVIPGVMVMLGCEQTNCMTGSLHSGELNLNEDALVFGADMFCEIADKICGISKMEEEYENHRYKI